VLAAESAEALATESNDPALLLAECIVHEENSRLGMRSGASELLG